jgi:NADPH:quinone reductase-like Zn-dependent oxidoreductase
MKAFVLRSYGSPDVTPVIDRCYRFEETPAAIKYQEEGHAPGKVVITV